MTANRFAALQFMHLNELRDNCLRIAVEHGFTDASVGEDIALMHSELSEALEDHRHGHSGFPSRQTASKMPERKDALCPAQGRTCVKLVPEPIAAYIGRHAPGYPSRASV